MKVNQWMDKCLDEYGAISIRHSTVYKYQNTILHVVWAWYC